MGHLALVSIFGEDCILRERDGSPAVKVQHAGIFVTAQLCTVPLELFLHVFR